MHVIRARNVHQALPEAIHQLHTHLAVERSSRNGTVLKFREPVTTVYERPQERVMFWAERDANPFFHLYESLWMLAGRNDLGSVAFYVKRMADFSDDGQTLHGAYGYRWRYHFQFDQLNDIIESLRENPDCRRQVLSMWDANVDLGRKGKDLPCNLQTVFQVNDDGALDMMVTNRSNDIIMGAYGANAVHFSYLQEYVARCVGVPQGVYRQVSANFHAYVSDLDKVESLRRQAADGLSGRQVADPYRVGAVSPYPLMSTPKGLWDQDLAMFIEGDIGAIGFRDPFFRRVAIPMAQAYAVYKSLSGEERYDAAQEIVLTQVAATDWQKAATEWLERRRENYFARLTKAQDDGPSYE